MSAPLRLSDDLPIVGFREALGAAERFVGAFGSAAEHEEALAAVYRLRLSLESARLESLMRPEREAAALDQLLRAKEAAERLNVSPAWLYREASRLPFTVRLTPGESDKATVRFSQKGIDAYIRRGGTR